MDISCAKQSDTPKYVVHLLGRYRRNTDNNTNYCDDTSKYVVHALEEALSKTYRRLPENRNHRHVISTSSLVQVVTAEAA